MFLVDYTVRKHRYQNNRGDNMIPVFNNTLDEVLQENVYYNKTYRVTDDGEGILGYIDNKKSVEQTCGFILNIERYKFPIYSWDYGSELVDLIGQDPQYVIMQAPGRIRESLIQDNRINDVTNFRFERDKKKLHVIFDVETVYGTIPYDMEVSL